MKKFTPQPDIIANPAVCHGKPTIKGTRVMIWQILELLEAGKASRDIYRAFPGLPRGSVEAALHFCQSEALLF